MSCIVFLLLSAWRRSREASSTRHRTGEVILACLRGTHGVMDWCYLHSRTTCSLNLTDSNVGGSISNHIANLTAISSIWLAGSNLTGPIPDMSPLHHLVSLHLENNRLTRPIPPSLGNLPRLQELFLLNNNLHGMIPSSLKSRTDIRFQYTPGNNLS